jgi:hypothetical protein
MIEGALMPYATNAVDGTRVHFEDDGGDGTPVVLHGGIIDSVDLVRESKIAQALQELPKDEFRLICVATADVDFHDQAQQAADEIPNAGFRIRSRRGAPGRGRSCAHRCSSHAACQWLKAPLPHLQEGA